MKQNDPGPDATAGPVDRDSSTLAVHSGGAVWHFDLVGGGFARLVDPEGLDWISWGDAQGSAGAYRGIPNMVFRPGKSPNVHNNFFHPGHRGDRASTSRFDQTPAGTTIQTTAGSGWVTRWQLAADRAVLDVRSVDPDDPSHWFLYEGTPGGTLDLSDAVVVPIEPRRRTLADSWQSTAGEVGWVAFTSGRSGRSLLVCWDRVDPDTPVSFWQMEQNMTVLGVGRALGPPVSHLTRPGARFALRLVPTTDPDHLAIECARLRQEALSPLRVLTLGDSITQGKASSDGSGWRGAFVDGCRQQGFEIELLGTQRSGPAGADAHEGHPGFSITQLRKLVERVELDRAPDIVVVHIGTNAHDHTPDQPLAARYAELLRAARQVWPEARLVCCTLPMNTLYPERIAELNAALPEIVAHVENACVVRSGEALTAREMTIDHDRNGRMVHPNDAGYAMIGRAIAQAVVTGPLP